MPPSVCVNKLVFAPALRSAAPAPAPLRRPLGRGCRVGSFAFYWLLCRCAATAARLCRVTTHADVHAIAGAGAGAATTTSGALCLRVGCSATFSDRAHGTSVCQPSTNTCCHHSIQKPRPPFLHPIRHVVDWIVVRVLHQ